MRNSLQTISMNVVSALLTSLCLTVLAYAFSRFNSESNDNSLIVIGLPIIHYSYWEGGELQDQIMKEAISGIKESGVQEYGLAGLELYPIISQFSCSYYIDLHLDDVGFDQEASMSYSGLGVIGGRYRDINDREGQMFLGEFSRSENSRDDAVHRFEAKSKNRAVLYTYDHCAQNEGKFLQNFSLTGVPKDLRVRYDVEESPYGFWSQASQPIVNTIYAFALTGFVTAMCALFVLIKMFVSFWVSKFWRLNSKLPE